MPPRGFLDLQHPIRGEGIAIYPPFEGIGAHLLAPDGLEVVVRDEGIPDFRLELVRGASPGLPPAPHGVLDLRLRPRYPFDAALPMLRERYPSAVLAPATISTGFLRIRAVTDTSAPTDLLRPVPLAWNGLGVARSILSLSSDAALVLKRALEDELLTVRATTELELLGVVPRLPVRLRFDPAALLLALEPLRNEQHLVTWDALTAFFLRDPDALPLELEADVPSWEREDFAIAMTARVRGRFGTFVPSAEPPTSAGMMLTQAADAGTGRFEWDLSEPTVAPFALVLHLDPMSEARALVGRAGVSAVYRETIVPPIPTGAVRVSLTANLPACRPGVLLIGATLRAAPRPPIRPQASIDSVELLPPEDAAVALLRLSPGEAVAYRCRTFVVLRDAGGTQRLEGPETQHGGERLDLAPDDFPVDFVPVSASRSLLEIASIRGVLRRSDSTAAVEEAFTLDVTQPSLALAIPRGVEGATIRIEAREHAGDARLSLGPLPLAPLQLELHSFPEYGPHRVEIECVFADGADLIALDLLPDGRADLADEISILHFTPERPTREWSWLARSPFQAGYRYRAHPAAGEGAGAWSALQSPFQRLVLEAEMTAGAGP